MSLDNSHASRADSPREASRLIIAGFAPVIEDFGELNRGLATLDAALSNLLDIERALSASAEPGASVRAAITEVSRCLTEVLRAMRVEAAPDRMLPFRALKRTAREIRNLATLTAIRTTGPSEAGFNAQGFINDLRELAARTEATLGTIEDKLQLVDAARRSAASVLSEATEAFRVEAVPTRTAATGQEEPSAARRDAGIPELKLAVTEIMPPIVACMQFPDAMDQRADHLEQLLDMARLEAESDPEWASEILRLSQAQAEDMETAYRSVLEGVASPLTALAQQAEDCRSRLTAEIGNDAVIRRLAEERASLTRMLAGMEAAQDTARRVGAALEQVETSLDGSRALLADLADLGENMRISALNVGIAAKRAGFDSSEMAVIARAAQTIAADFDAGTKRVAAEVDRTVDHAQRIETDDLLSALDSLSRELGAATSDLDAIATREHEARDASIAVATGISDVSEALGRSAQSLSRASAIAHRLRSVCEAIARSRGDVPAQPQAASPDRLARVEALYTMEAERAVHRVVFGQADERAADAPSGHGGGDYVAGAADELDDIFF